MSFLNLKIVLMSLKMIQGTFVLRRIYPYIHMWKLTRLSLKKEHVTFISQLKNYFGEFKNEHVISQLENCMDEFKNEHVIAQLENCVDD